MAVLYWNKQRFPHVHTEINDYSSLTLPATPLDNTIKVLQPIVANYGPDDRTLYLRIESDFDDIYGPQTWRKHYLMGKAAKKVLRAGGHVMVRRITDDASKNANVSLDVTIETLTTPRDKYFIVADGTWSDTQPTTGVADTDYVKVTLTTAPVIKYGSTSHPDIKTKTDAELIGITTGANSTTIPVYTLMRTGAGINGNKTEVAFTRLENVSSNLDNIYEMNIVMSTDKTRTERYRVNAVQDSRMDGIPLNMGQVLNNQSDQVTVVFTDANDTKLNELVLDALEKLITDLETAIGAISSQTIKDALTVEKDKVQSILTDLDEGIIETTALTTMFNTNFRFQIISSLMEDQTTYIEKVKFDNGTNGDLLKGKFDWNYTVEINSEQVRIYEILFRNFFQGGIDPDIYDINDTPADMILDIGYPLVVKQAMGTFTSIPYRRDIITTCCPPGAGAKSLADLRSFDEQYKPTNYMMLKVVNWSDYYDPDEQRTLYVPTTYLMIESLVAFYNEGWSNPPLSGRIIAGPVTGTVVPTINTLTDIEDKNYLYDNAWNYLSNTTLGYMLDGQRMANADPYVVSILQEFHNGALLGRIIKKINDCLNRNKHFMQNDAGVKNVETVVNAELEEFRSKCEDITYSAYYKDTFDSATGYLTHEINLTLWNTNKSHKIELNAYRYDMSGSAA